MTWTQITNGVIEKLSAMIVTNRGVAFAVNKGLGFLRSTDSGASWENITVGGLTRIKALRVHEVWMCAVSSITRRTIDNKTFIVYGF